jgi:hypothetical protein
MGIIYYYLPPLNFALLAVWSAHFICSSCSNSISRSAPLPCYSASWCQNWLSVYDINIIAIFLLFRFWARSQDLRKATISLICPSVRLYLGPFAWNTSASTGRIFTKFGIWEFFDKQSKKKYVSLKSDNNNGQLTRRFVYIYDDTFLNVFKTRNVSDKICLEIQNLHLCSVTFYFFENRAFYDIMWKYSAFGKSLCT